MGFREDTDTLNEMRIQQVAGLLGIHISTDRLTRCPFPDHDDTDPSFKVWSPGNRWTCFGCQRHGGAIDFVKLYHGTDFLSARHWLENRVGLATISSIPTQRTIPIKRYTDSSLPTTNYDTEPPPDSELYNTVLDHAPIHSSGMEYLRSRGLSGKTISRFRVGQLPDSRRLLEYLIRIYGYRRTNDAGLLTKSSTAQNPQLIFPQRGLLFPFFEDGDLVYLQVRLLSDSTTNRRWCNLNRRKLRIFNIDAILPINHRPIAVCEGVIDTMSATELNYDSIGLVGVNMQLDESLFRRLGQNHITILFDWDRAGDNRAATLQQELSSHGITSTRKRCPLPNVKDINDYLKIRGSKQ